MGSGPCRNVVATSEVTCSGDQSLSLLAKPIDQSYLLRVYLPLRNMKKAKTGTQRMRKLTRTAGQYLEVRTIAKDPDVGSHYVLMRLAACSVDKGMFTRAWSNDLLSLAAEDP